MGFVNKLASNQMIIEYVTTDDVIVDLKNLLNNDVSLEREINEIGETVKAQNVKLEEMVACRNACAVSCSGTCSEYCSGNCKDSCEDNCTGSCVGTCSVNCTSCTSDCGVSCGSGCDNSCSGH